MPRRASPPPARSATQQRPGRARRSITARLRSRLPARTPRCNALSATSTTISQHCRRTAARAIWRSTSPPPIRRMRRPASPPPARSATPQRPGRARRSITTTRRSRSPARTPQCSAPNATSTIISQRCRRTAAPATWRSTSRTTNPPHASAGFPTTCSLCHTTASWAGATFQSQQHAVPAHWRAHHGAMRAVPRQQQFHNLCRPIADRATGAVQVDHQSTACVGGLPHHLLALPHHGVLGRCDVQSQQHAVPAHRRAHHGAVRAVPRQQQFHHVCPPIVTPATRRTIRAPPIRTMWPPASPPIARCATAPPTGPAPPSTTAPPDSRSPARIRVAVRACHVGGKFTGLSASCYSCHQTQYQSTTNPNHAAAGFPQDCSVCHSTTSWAGAVFDHSKTPFPLTGAHTTVACASCHVNNKFAGTPTDCYSCHQTVYNSTTNPNHIAAGFPHTCDTCHTTTTWSGATFNHTWFRLPHNKAGCSDCHTNSANYAVFVCTNCHTQKKTDPEHSGVKGLRL